MNRAESRRAPGDKYSPEVGDLLGRAQTEYDAGRLAQAASFYEQVLAKHPDHPDANNGLGIIVGRFGMFEPASQLFARAVQAAPANPFHHNNLGNALRELGRTDEALASFDRAVALKSDYAGAYSNRGIVLAAVGRREEAVASYRKAVSLKPDFAEAHNNLGAVLYSLGRTEEAITAYQRSIALMPTYADAHRNLGNALRSAGRLADAVDRYHHALSLAPNSAETYNDLGVALKDLGRSDEAIECYGKVAALKPDYADGPYNLGVLFHDLGRMEEAIAAYRQAIAIKPDHVSALDNLSNTLMDVGRMDEALAFAERAVVVQPRRAAAYVNLGCALFETGRFEDAAAALDTGRDLNPGLAQVHSNLGKVLLTLGRPDEAVASARRAIAIEPTADAHINLGFALLWRGEVREGLDELEWRWRTRKYGKGLRRFVQPQWDGVADLTGKTILVWGEQGLGDEIMWSAFVPEIVVRAGRCIVECAPKLAPLLARSFPRAEVRPTDRTRDEARTDIDLHVPMGSLFRVLGAEAPRTDAFLVPDPERVAYWKGRLAALGSGPFVGMAWTSSMVDASRSHGYTRLEDWAPVFGTPEVVFVNLQHGDCADALKEANTRFGVVVHAIEDLDLFDDLVEVANLIAALDLVITIGTAVSAIAAGVGTPTWRMTWRHDSNNNSLYTLAGPSVTHYYRDTGDTWDAAFKDIAGRLAALASSGGG